MKWLITGGCGFIGTSLVRRLKDSGHQIRIVDNLSVGTLENLRSVTEFVERGRTEFTSRGFEPDGRVQMVRGDILDAQLALEVGQGAEIIVHLAANTGVASSVAEPRADCMANVVGTLNYLETSRRN